MANSKTDSVMDSTGPILRIDIPAAVVMTTTKNNDTNVNRTWLAEWSTENNTDIWATYSEGYVGEMIWGVVLCIVIVLVNLSVMAVVGTSRELWKPRHLWMACLCFSDLLVAAHKGLDIALMCEPSRFLCALQRSTLGIPYVANMMVLTLLSLDRFVAVRFPFFYSREVGKRHVVWAYIVVLLTSGSLAAASVLLALEDMECRAQPLQLIYLTCALILCSCLSLLFNGSVLRIARRQLNAIYAQEEAIGKRRVSILCSKCGFKNETFVNALLPLAATATAGNSAVLRPQPAQSRSRRTSLAITSPTTLPLPLPLPKGHLFQTDLEKVAGHLEQRLENALVMDLRSTTQNVIQDNDGHAKVSETIIQEEEPEKCANHNVTPDLLNLPVHEMDNSQSNLNTDDISNQIIRTLSLPNLDLPPPDVTSLITTATLQPAESADMDKAPSLPELSNGPPNNINPTATSTLQPPFQRSLSYTCRVGCKLRSQRLHMFRHLHFTAGHLFHVRRLSPSIRFARTVLLILIPTWIFILPIVTIIPLHQDCVDGVARTGINCSLVECLWAYLLIHMRNVLPLQAILDTLIYACSSTEFKVALRRRIQSWSHK